MKLHKSTGYCRLAVLMASLFFGASAFATPQTELIDPMQDPVQDPLQDPLDDLIQPQPVEPRFIDKEIAGWQRPGTEIDGPRLGTDLSANWVVMNEKHGISGQIVNATGPITLHLLRNGFVASTVTSDEFGSFEFESATEGVYSLVGRNRDCFVAFGFLALENDGVGVNLPLRIQSFPVFGPENFRLIAKLVWQDSAKVTFPPHGVYDVGETPADPAEFFGFTGLKDLSVEAFPATTIQHQAIALQADGRFIGRIYQVNSRSGRPVEVRDTSVKVIQSGELVAETRTDVFGVFEIDGLLPGTYGLVATGVDGLAVVGIELVAGGESLVPPNQEGRIGPYDSIIRFAGHSVFAESSSFECLLCDPESIGWINAYVYEEEYQQSMEDDPLDQFANQQVPFDNFNGGLAGAGDTGLGLGGFGDLLLAGAVGIAIADAATSETDLGGGLVLPPASPFTR